MAGYISGLLPLTSGEQTGQIIVPADDLGRQLEEIVIVIWLGYKWRSTRNAI